MLWVKKKEIPNEATRSKIEQTPNKMSETMTAINRVLSTSLKCLLSVLPKETLKNLLQQSDLSSSLALAKQSSL